jgi:hypothetical protein
MTKKKKTNKKRANAPKSSEKHFLDTSVARPILTGATKYRAYYSSQFKTDRLYVSRFVKMEFRRSFILNLINFFDVLDMPEIQCIDDATTLWSNRFKTSELKAVLQIIAKLFDTQRLSGSSAKDKEKALRVLGILIKRYQTLIEGYTDVGTNTTHCARAQVPLNIDLANLREDITTFFERFNDTKTCRDNCVIDKFLLARYRTEVERYVTVAKSLKTGKGNDGFKRIAENLEQILSGGPSACSCKRCEKIGDAVIALDTPRNLPIEHTDYSFDHLCSELAQPHRRHPSEVTFFASLTKKSRPEVVAPTHRKT